MKFNIKLHVKVSSFQTPNTCNTYLTNSSLILYHSDTYCDSWQKVNNIPFTSCVWIYVCLFLDSRFLIEKIWTRAIYHDCLLEIRARIIPISFWGKLLLLWYLPIMSLTFDLMGNMCVKFGDDTLIWSVTIKILQVSAFQKNDKRTDGLTQNKPATSLKIILKTVDYYMLIYIMMKNLESDSAKYKPTFPKINRTPGAAMKSLYFLTNFNHIKLKFQDHQVLTLQSMK